MIFSSCVAVFKNFRSRVLTAEQRDLRARCRGGHRTSLRGRGERSVLCLLLKKHDFFVVVDLIIHPLFKRLHSLILQPMLTG